MADETANADVKVDAASEGGVDASAAVKPAENEKKPAKQKAKKKDEDGGDKPASGSFKDGKFIRSGK